jgi:hypothetical protein
MFHAIRSAPPGSWQGPKPRSFGYPVSTYLWGGAHHRLPGSFLSSVSGGCYICYTIFRDCNASQRKLAQSFQIYYRFYALQEEALADQTARYGLRFGIEVEPDIKNVVGEFFYDCQGDFKVLPLEGMPQLFRAEMLRESSSDVREDIQPSMMQQWVPRNTSDPKCLDMARTWLTDCLRSHEVCQRHGFDQEFYPTRLLDLGTALNAPSCRLQNCVKETPSGPYCTLSHCWGKGDFVSLKTTTLHKLEKGISVSLLSKTFQDAIYAVRRLGVRYLWIDALCIIQDSAEDWEKEAALMSELYAKSHCNIAATDAVNGEGCFVDRDVSRVEPCLIESSTFKEDSIGHHVVAYDDFWSINLRNAPLHQRGWVLQERLLSPRTIHFGSEQMFWECDHHKACESYPRGIPAQLKNPRAREWRLFHTLWSQNRSAPASEEDGKPSKLNLLHEQWRETVEWYMECRISHQRDKLVAIAGIAHTLAKATGERYLAGLWENQELAVQMLWHVLSRCQADNSASQRSQVCRAPSWSWACLEATIVWNWPSAYKKALVSSVEAKIVPRGNDPMCEISYAALYVQGCLFQAEIEIARVKADGTYDEDGEYNLLIDYEEISEDGTVVPLSFPISGPVIHLDTALLPTLSRTVYCLPMCTEWTARAGNGALRIAGLLLIPNPEAEKQYTRIGIFGLDEEEACHFCGLDISECDRIDEVLCSMQSETITLI